MRVRKLTLILGSCEELKLSAGGALSNVRGCQGGLKESVLH